MKRLDEKENKAQMARKKKEKKSAKAAAEREAEQKARKKRMNTYIFTAFGFYALAVAWFVNPKLPVHIPAGIALAAFGILYTVLAVREKNRK